VTEAAVLTSIAGYTAQAVERALFLDERISVAHQLQDAVLITLPAVPGLDLAALYRPASTTDMVGDDWYDAFFLPRQEGSAGPEDGLAVTVGDITSRDVQAATPMGQTRSMLRQASVRDGCGRSIRHRARRMREECGCEVGVGVFFRSRQPQRSSEVAGGRESVCMDVRSRNNVTITGREDGPVVVLAHGFGCDQNMWRLVVPALAERFRLVLFDHVGSGQSDASAWQAQRYASLDGYAQDVLELCRELDLREVMFVGHSVSSVIGVLAAGHEPERFAKLILITPSPRYVDDGDYRGGFSAEDIEELLDSLESNYLGWSAEMAPVIMGNPERPELGEELTNSFCRTDPDMARVFARATFLSDNRADLAGVSVPTLVVECSSDVIAPREVGAYVHATIPGSRLVTLDATGHCPQLSAPEATAEAIISFAGEGR
jgi:sigma-B regulation protein RsbQ